MVEQKVIASVRKILIADSTLNAVVSTHVYASHISSIKKPDYPCISLHLLSSPGAEYSAMGYKEITLQIDGWFPNQQYDLTSVLNLAERIRTLLHRQSITDKTIPVAGAGFEKIVGQLMDEEDTKLLHLPMVYTFRAY